ALATSASSTGDTCIRTNRSVHQFRFTEAILQKTVQRVLSRIDAAPIAVGDATNAHAVEHGVWLCFICPKVHTRQDRLGRKTSGAAEDDSPRQQSLMVVPHHLRSLKKSFLLFTGRRRNAQASTSLSVSHAFTTLRQTSQRRQTCLPLDSLGPRE